MTVTVFDLLRIAASGLVTRIDYHESLGSTNDRALGLAAQDDILLPLLVLAQRQTAGRGRGTNRWWSPEGALSFSLILAAPPDRLPPQSWPQAALIAGLAVCEALELLAADADLRVKWPNDVYLGPNKVCGILSESVPGWRDRLVVGIGINVNNSGKGSGFGVQGSEGGARAAALIDHDGLARDLSGVLLAVLDQFGLRWRNFLDDGFSSLVERYRQRCFLTGKVVMNHQPGGQSIVGICRGIDDRGALRVASEDAEHRIVSGTVYDATNEGGGGTLS
jgi:BirA family biotin operon repressor/biotin-[acetyl-CoA-carboxylase] ligase